MLSVIIITKNEEHNIRECLDSVSWADEVIVVDSGSTDNTMAIAREYTERVISTKWLGFGPTKNRGIEHAKGEWILSIDADERVTGKLKDEIQSAMQKVQETQKSEKSGYYIPRILYFCGCPVKRGGTYPDYQLRLFKKNEGKFNDMPVHEKVVLTGDVGHLKHALIHKSYRTMSEYWERFNKYTSLDAEKKFNAGKKFRAVSALIFPWELFRRLILKRGMLDGIPGIFYHIFSAMSSLVKYAKLWEMNKQKKGNNGN